MEHTSATRRVKRILGHLSRSEEISASTPHLSFMNCNSTLNSMAQRNDNRALISRQGSVSQACSVNEDLHCKCSCTTNRISSYENQEEKLFSGKARETPSLANIRDVDSSKQNSTPSSIEALKIAGPGCRKIKEQLVCRTSHPAISDVDTGLVWSPRIDVAESSSNYVLIVELPGVNINEIRVEVDDQNLTITGKRIMQKNWRTMNSSRDSNLTYHRKEILQGPYEVDWPLPKDADRNRASAEFILNNEEVWLASFGLLCNMLSLVGLSIFYRTRTES